MEHATFAPEQVLHFADLAMQRLSEAREEIDALNVYPVPDGDTGTNMYLTVESARAALTDVERQVAWDWRRDLAELEARMEQLAIKHGLSPKLEPARG